MDCRYDGSYAGLLTLLYRLFARREEPTLISAGSPQQEELFAPVFESATDPGLAARLIRVIHERLGEESAHQIRYAFLAETPGRELAIHAYLKLGWQLRRQLERHLAHPIVASIHRQARRTRHEVDRLRGLVRFAETSDGLFYARVRPEADILALLASHFARRLGDRPWLIHDLRRNLGALFDGRSWMLGRMEQVSNPAFSPEEHQWQELWRTFFHHIAIPERINPRLQKSFMPMKYWEFLVEMKEADQNKAEDGAFMANPRSISAGSGSSD